MKKVAVLLLCALMAACAVVPKKLREPDDSIRVPINRTVPPEVLSGVVN